MFGTEYSFLELFLNFFILFLGVISHFFKKKIKGETLSDVKDYFRSHFNNTVTTIIASIVLFGSLVATGGIGIIASFTAGYACDSLFNKADGNATIKK